MLSRGFRTSAEQFQKQDRKEVRPNKAEDTFAAEIECLPNKGIN